MYQDLHPYTPIYEISINNEHCTIHTIAELVQMNNYNSNTTPKKLSRRYLNVAS